MALWSLAAYWLAFGLTRALSPMLIGEPDLGHLGLSAGVQLVVLMVGGPWGLLGLAGASFMAAQALWPEVPSALLAGHVATDLAVPGLVLVALRRALSVAPDLSGLGFPALVTMLLAALVAQSAATTAYTVATRALPWETWMPLASARLMGDFLGTSVVLALLVLLVTLVQRRRLSRRGD